MGFKNLCGESARLIMGAKMDNKNFTFQVVRRVVKNGLSKVETRRINLAEQLERDRREAATRRPTTMVGGASRSGKPTKYMW